jgi:hypothetical protein
MRKQGGQERKIMFEKKEREIAKASLVPQSISSCVCPFCVPLKYE